MIGHTDEVGALCYLFEKGNNSWIASGSHDKVIIIWDIEKLAMMK